MDDQPQGPSSPAPASRRSPRRTSFDPPSRRSTNQRIGEILETARERAEQMAPSETPSPYDTISRSSAVRPAAPWLGHEDSSADENTGLVNSANRRASRRLETNANEPHRKSTNLRNSRDGSDTHAGDGQQGQNSQNGDGLTQTNGSSTHANHNSWGEKVFKRFYSVELENKGSVARDHLALERTFLAWLRTSLAFASIGIAVTQLFRLNTSLNGNAPEDGRIHTLRHVGKPLGAAFLGISILTLILGYRRFLQGQEWVIKGKFPASRGTVLILVFMSLAIMLLSLVVVIVIHPTHADGDL